MVALLLLLACSTSSPPRVAAPPPDAPGAGESPDAADVPMAPVQEQELLSEAEFAALHELSAEEAPPPRGEEISLAGGRAYLSRPPGEVQGGVVVIHEWWGLNSHIRHWTDRLAADGYLALAVDLYQGEVASSPDAAMAAMKKVDEADARAMLQAAHAWLEEQGVEQSASIGWCFGGGWSLQLGLMEPELDAVVIYYGKLETDPQALEPIEAPVLGIFGTRDKGIPPDKVEEFRAAMERAGKQVQILSYEADHAFANPSSGRYDATAAEEAWQKVRAFLARELD